MTNKKRKALSVAALCAAGVLALNLGGAEAHFRNGGFERMGGPGGCTLSWSQQEALRQNREALMQAREKQIQALGKILFSPEAVPGEGKLFSPEALKKALPLMEQMVLERHRAFEEGRKLLTRDQREMMQKKMPMEGPSSPCRRNAKRGPRNNSGESWSMGFLGGYVDHALGFTSGQREAFRKSLEVDGITSQRHRESRERFFRALKEENLTEEQLSTMAREKATFWEDRMTRLNRSLENLYPTFSENQKKAFGEMRERMAENMEAGIFFAPRMPHPHHPGGGNPEGKHLRGGEQCEGCSDKGNPDARNFQNHPPKCQMIRMPQKPTQGQ